MRKAKPKKRILLPDPKYHDTQVTRFVNNLMLQGKKSIAYSIFYDAIDLVGEKMKDSDKAPLDIWRKALENVTSPASAQATPWQKNFVPRSSPHTTTKAAPTSARKTCTRWQKPTRHSHISVFS